MLTNMEMIEESIAIATKKITDAVKEVCQLSLQDKQVTARLSKLLSMLGTLSNLIAKIDKYKNKSVVKSQNSTAKISTLLDGLDRINSNL